MNDQIQSKPQVNQEETKKLIAQKIKYNIEEKMPLLQFKQKQTRSFLGSFMKLDNSLNTIPNYQLNDSEEAEKQKEQIQKYQSQKVLQPIVKEEKLQITIPQAREVTPIPKIYNSVNTPQNFDKILQEYRKKQIMKTMPKIIQRKKPAKKEPKTFLF